MDVKLIFIVFICIFTIQDTDAWRRRRRRRRSDPPPPPPPPPNTPPKFRNCPQSLTTQYTITSTAVVTWVEPECYDTETTCTISRSGLSSGSKFAEGSHSIAYTATDTQGLSSACTVSFTVVVIRCADATTPQHGIKSCTNSNSVGSVCTYYCATGLTLSGSSQRVCQEVSNNQAQWTGSQPQCEDLGFPTISNCPSDMVVDRTDFWGVQVTFSKPTATDNFDQTLQSWTVPADLTSPYNFTEDTTCEYHFRDDAGNTASCTFDVQIHDLVSPEFLTCPASKYLRTSVEMTPVTWEEPTVRDIPGNEVRVTCNYGSNSVLLPWGTNHVIYTATNMKNGLDEKCEFDVTIEPTPCPKLRTPAHGAISCDRWVYGRYCSMSCNEDYDIPPPSPFQPATPDVFACSSSGLWTPTSYVPDCSQTRDPSKINLPTDLLYYSGQCGNPSTFSSIAQSFIETVEKSVHSDICTLNQDCTVENVVISCGWPPQRRRRYALMTGRRRRGTDEASVIHPSAVNIEERIFDGLQGMRISMDLGVGVTHARNATVALEKLHDLAREVLNIAVADENDIFNLAKVPHHDTPDVFLSVSEHRIQCPDGHVSSRNETICVACTTGHYFDSKTRTCQQCGYGLYQDEYSQLGCKSCDIGQSTKNKGTPNISDCKDQCLAGHFSTSGLSPCILCPLDTFQPLIGQTMCFECPDGKKTWNRGSSKVEQCVHIQY